jgi:hypothetical protein
MSPLALVLSALFIFGGCSFTTTVVNDPITQEDVGFIIPHHTTRAEILDELGAPQEITATTGRDVYRYRYQVQRTVRISLGSLTRGFVPVTFSRGNTGLNVFEVQFDAAGVVQEYAFKLRADQARFNPWPF